MEIVQFFANGFLNTVLLSLYRSAYPSIPFGSISRLAVKYNGQEVRSAPSTSPHNQQATNAPLLLIRLGSMRCLIDSLVGNMRWTDKPGGDLDMQQPTPTIPAVVPNQLFRTIIASNYRKRYILQGLAWLLLHVLVHLLPTISCAQRTTFF